MAELLGAFDSGLSKKLPVDHPVFDKLRGMIHFETSLNEWYAQLASVGTIDFCVGLEWRNRLSMQSTCSHLNPMYCAVILSRRKPGQSFNGKHESHLHQSRRKWMKRSVPQHLSADFLP